MTRSRSTPSSSRMSSVWWRSEPTPPLCREMGAPVTSDASPAARMLFSSLGLIGPPLTPISPMIPDLMPVPPTPSVTSVTMTSVRSSTERRSMSTGWYTRW